MSTTLEQYPEQVAEAIRDMLDTSIDREVPAITVINHMLRQLDPDEAERVLTWAWDRWIVHSPYRVEVEERAA